MHHTAQKPSCVLSELDFSGSIEPSAAKLVDGPFLHTYNGVDNCALNDAVERPPCAGARVKKKNKI